MRGQKDITMTSSKDILNQKGFLGVTMKDKMTRGVHYEQNNEDPAAYRSRDNAVRFYL
jgi:hypothetical protein